MRSQQYDQVRLLIWPRPTSWWSYHNLTTMSLLRTLRWWWQTRWAFRVQFQSVWTNVQGGLWPILLLGWTLIAERLSVRLIIMQAQRAIVGSLSEVVFVCLSGLQLKYTGLRIVYVSCSMCPLCFTLALVMEDSLEDRRWRQAREWMQRYRRWLSAQQRDERQ